MSNLEYRGLRKAYARCPRCGRVFKVRVKQKTEVVGRIGAWQWVERKKPDEWVLEREPPHRKRVSDPERLGKLIKKGCPPEENPWCKGWSNSEWKIIGWRD